MTTWTFGGTALTTFGKVIQINDYLDVVTRRGENIVLPFRHGTNFVRKYYGERTLTFGITLNATSAGTLESTINTLKTLLSPLTQQTLSQTNEDASVWNIQATVDELLEPNRVTNTLLRYVVTFRATFPFWRLSTEIANNETTIDASPKAMTVTNPGTVEERDATIVLTGPLSNTVITNSTNGCVLTYTGTIASPRIVTLSVSSGEIVATDDLGANKIGNLTHSPESAMMVFNVGSNSLSITDDTHTTGKVRVRFNAPYL